MADMSLFALMFVVLIVLSFEVDFAKAACGISPDYDGNVVIPSTMTSIPEKYFYTCTSLKNVTFHSGLTTIETGAFQGSGLTSLTILSSISFIGNEAFRSCRFLKSVTINNANGGGSTAFYGCTSLSTVTFGPAVIEIPGYLFTGCTSLEQITIPPLVKTISSRAFWNCKALRSVVIPDAVQTIGMEAFSSCSSLSSVTLGKAIVSLEGDTFLDSKAIQSVELRTPLLGSSTSFMETYFGDSYSTSIFEVKISGDEVKVLGTSAFAKMTNLRSVVINSSSVTTFGENCFLLTKVLQTMTIPDSVTTILGSAFSQSGLLQLTLPNKLTSISKSAFSNCQSLKSVVLPSSLKTIEFDAFYNCKNLDTITIPNGVTLISDNAFSAAKFSSLVIPDSVQTIKTFAFSSNTALTSVTIGSSVTMLEDSTIFKGCSNIETLTIRTPLLGTQSNFTLKYFPSATARIREVVISGPAVKTIGDSALRGLSGVQNVTITSPVVSIGDYAFIRSGLTTLSIPSSVKSVGFMAFSASQSLESIVIPASVTTIGEGAFMSCTSLRSVALLSNALKTIQFRMFKGCVALVNISLPASVTYVEKEAFDQCRSLQSVIGPSVDRVGHSAFRGCSALTDVQFSPAFRRFADYAFADCTSLREFHISDSVTSVNYRCFYGCTSLSNLTVGASVSGMNVDGGIFSACPIQTLTIRSPLLGTQSNFTLKYFPSATARIREVVISGPAVKAIGDSAFRGLRDLQSVEISAPGVTTIGTYAFSGTAIATIDLPNSLVSIGAGAFSYNDNLQSIAIPDSVTVISASLFRQCRSLTNVSIGARTTVIGGSAFSYCDELSQLALPETITSIGGGAFYGADSLAAITFPPSLTTIKGWAFARTPLLNVSIPASVKTIESYAFNGAVSLRSVHIEGGSTINLHQGVFKGASELRSVVIDTTNSAIFGEDVFEACVSLKALAFQRSISSIVGLPEWGYACNAGSSCMCLPGYENSLVSESDYFDCSPCGVGSFSHSISIAPGSCEFCPGGTYADKQASTLCEYCPMGKHFDGVGATTGQSCQNCGPGTYGDVDGMPVCNACPAGRFSSAIKAITINTCHDCQLGKFSAIPGASVCSSCPVGRFGAATSVSSCAPCTLGRYAPTVSTTECLSCPKNQITLSEASTSISDCVPCPTGKYSPLGSKTCDACEAGKYNGADSGEDCKKCAAGQSTSGLVGQSACLACQAGYFQVSEGSPQCDECPVDTYSVPGSKECLTCEGGKSTNSIKGSSACSVPGAGEGSSLSLRSREGVLQVFRTGMAYMITILCCIAFAVFGYLIMMTRVKNARLCALQPAMVAARMAMVALSLISEAFLLAIMFAEGAINPLFARLGFCIVSFRAGNVVPTVSILYAIFGSTSTALTERYKKCFDQDHFVATIYPHAGLSFLALLDCQLIFLFPWKYSEFAEKAKGYPDMLSLRVTSYYRIAQDIVRFVCNIMYLVHAKNEAADASVEVMTYFNMLASVVSIVLAGMIAVMKNSVLTEIEAKKGTAADMDSDDSIAKTSPMHPDADEDGGISMGPVVTTPGKEDDDMELGTPDLYLSTEMIYTANPLHSLGKQGRGKKVDKKKTIRAFIIELLPEIEAPSVHAVDTAFRTDGVETVQELVQYLEGGVISVADLRSYSKHGKFSMAYTLKFIRAVEELLSDYNRTPTNHSSDSLGPRSPSISSDAGTVIDRERHIVQDQFNQIISHLEDVLQEIKANEKTSKDDKVGSSLPVREENL